MDKMVIQYPFVVFCIVKRHLNFCGKVLISVEHNNNNHNCYYNDNNYDPEKTLSDTLCSKTSNAI